MSTPNYTPPLGQPRRLRSTKRRGDRFESYYWQTSDGLRHELSVDELLSVEHFQSRLVGLPETLR